MEVSVQDELQWIDIGWQRYIPSIYVCSFASALAIAAVKNRTLMDCDCIAKAVAIPNAAPDEKLVCDASDARRSYPIHPLAELFPSIEGAELDTLVASLV